MDKDCTNLNKSMDSTGWLCYKFFRGSIEITTSESSSFTMSISRVKNTWKDVIRARKALKIRRLRKKSKLSINKHPLLKSLKTLKVMKIWGSRYVTERTDPGTEERT